MKDRYEQVLLTIIGLSHMADASYAVGRSGGINPEAEDPLELFRPGGKRLTNDAPLSELPRDSHWLNSLRELAFLLEKKSVAPDASSLSEQKPVLTDMGNAGNDEGRRASQEVDHSENASAMHRDAE